MYKVDSISDKDVLDIINWHYPKPYDIYNMKNDEETVCELLSGCYYSVKRDKQLIGYYCYGTYAQIPTREAQSFYNDNNFIDIGLGLNPNMCSRGLGEEFVLTGIKYALNTFDSSKFRLTVASFNERAITVYKRVGFTIKDSFIRSSNKMKFFIMVTDKIY